MSDIVPDAVTQFADDVSAVDDEVLQSMADHASDTAFPTIGPELGAWLSLLVRATDAQRVFEFGSGFGYSAYWFARALGPNGTVVLTEIHEAELDRARKYFEDGGYADRAQFEHGDAIDIVRQYDGHFDIVLIDNEKDRYVEAFEAVRPRLQSGSLVLADNALTAGHVDRDDVFALLKGDDVPDATDASRGISAYLQHLGDSDNIETTLLPLGEGMAVSVIC